VKGNIIYDEMRRKNGGNGESINSSTISMTIDQQIENTHTHKLIINGCFLCTPKKVLELSSAYAYVLNIC